MKCNFNIDIIDSLLKYSSIVKNIPVCLLRHEILDFNVMNLIFDINVKAI